MNIVLLLIGGFYAIEGAANLVWWHLYPPLDTTNSKMETVWETGRFLRVALGVALIYFSLFL